MNIGRIVFRSRDNNVVSDLSNRSLSKIKRHHETFSSFLNTLDIKLDHHFNPFVYFIWYFYHIYYIMNLREYQGKREIIYEKIWKQRICPCGNIGSNCFLNDNIRYDILLFLSFNWRI